MKIKLGCSIIFFLFQKKGLAQGAQNIICGALVNYKLLIFNS